MSFPRDPAPDATLSLLAEGYRFIGERARRWNTDAFETRLMLRRALCVTGRDAAEMFYGGDHFTRAGAMPAGTVRLLQDLGSVQTLDGEAHRHRKALFMALMTPERIDALVAIFREEWARRSADWRREGRVVLFDALRPLLTAEDERRRSDEFGAEIDGSGSVGLRHWRGRLLRSRNESWARAVIDRVRRGTIEAPDDSAVHAIATHRDPSGRLLTIPVAAVELINVLRPTVAVGRFITFAALALHEHPEWPDRLSADPSLVEPFVQEVRRLAPFFPLIAGRARAPFRWRGEAVDGGAWVILDLYGTNRDASVWDRPEAFRPERFADRTIGPYDLVPQGGGGYLDSHRCPGEWITIALMKAAVEGLVRLPYTVPAQDLSVRLSQMPARPASGFVMALPAG